MSNFSEINFILLDLDDTLYSYDPPHEYGLGKMLELFETFVPLEKGKLKEVYLLNRKKINERLVGQAASHSRLLYAKEMCECIGISPILYARELEFCYWDNFLSKMVLDPGVFEFFEFCKAGRIKICIVTDLTTDIQLNKLKKLNIESYIDFVVTSEEAGAEKPDPRIFNLAISKLHADPKKTVMIGDNFEKDVIGAKNIGLQSIHFDRKKKTSHSVSTFYELLDKIK